jgi:hypothetical protein
MSELIQASKPIPFKIGLQVPRSIVPPRRRKAIFGPTRKQLGPIFHARARQTGKSAIAMARLGNKEKTSPANTLGPRYAVSTVGFELEQVRTYIREQNAADGPGGLF